MNITSKKLYDIIEIFKNMSMYYKISGDTIRENAYNNATNTLMKILLSKQINLDDIINSKYIGKRLGSHIIDIINTGTYSEYENFKNDFKVQVILKLQEVWGIGPVLANRLYKKHIYTLADLKKIKNTLPQNVQYGIKFYHDFNQIIDKRTINKFSKTINSQKNISVILCGSARRGLSPYDLDYLLITPSCNDNKNDNKINIKNLIEHSDEFSLIAILAYGEKKCMLIVQDIHTKRIFRVDLRLIDEKSEFAATLYFTGPKLFNIWMRSRAIEKGLLLNEYGLFKGTKLIPITSEKDIFDLLDVKYLSPKKRSNFWLYI